MRFLVARKIGLIRERRLAGGAVGYYLDFRPHGRIWSIPMPGGSSLPIRDEGTADDLLSVIRGDFAAGKTLEQALAPYLPSRAKPNLVGTRLARWIETKELQVEAGDRSPTYLRELRRYARGDGYFSFLTDLSVYEINYGVLEDWLEWMATRDLSAKTRRNALGAFRSFLHWLQRRGEIERVPEFPEVPVDEHSPTIISAETQSRVLQAIPEDRRGAFLAGARLGLRPSEIRALNLDDYHDGWLTVSKAVKGPNATAPIRGTKTRKIRRLPVDDELRAWIEVRSAGIASEERLRGPVALFPNPTARNPERRWIANALREEWNRACRRVGVRVGMYEGTKHAFATDALLRGVTRDKIQKFLGHADGKSTDRYAKLADGALVEVLPASDLSLACRWSKNGGKKPSENAGLWRGGRDSNPQPPA